MNLSLVFIRKKEIQLQPPGEPRDHRLGEVLQGRSKSKFYIILSFFLKIFLYLSSGVIFHKFQNKPPGEPREHYLGEVIQGSLKSKLYR